MKLYIIQSNPDDEDCVYYLMAEDGETLYSHYCSDHYYAMSDLVEGRPERIKELKEKYGEYEVLYLNEQKNITLEDLQKKNQEWFDNLSEEEKKEMT